MILHRMVIQAKAGKADNVVSAMKDAMAGLNDEQRSMLQPRVLTDISGSFDTVVVETTHQSLAAYEEFRKMIFARNAENPDSNPMSEYMVSGRNEYYTIEF